MLVGEAMGGKTTITATLADALSRIEAAKKLVDDLEDEEGKDKDNSMEISRVVKPPKVRIHSINPKSVSIG